MIAKPRIHIHISFVFMAASLLTAGAQQRSVTIEDCIRMVRIQQTYDDDPTVVFSGDGRQFVTMTWLGNLSTNLNDYTVLLFDAEHLDRLPKELLKVSFVHKDEDLNLVDSRPLKQFTFLSHNRLAALATLRGEPRQVISIDLGTKAVTPLTKHPGGVLAFATADGNSLVYAAQAPSDHAKRAALYRDGFSLEDRGAIGARSLPDIAMGNWLRPMTQYFFVSGPGSPPRKINEGGDDGFNKWIHPTFRISPDGRHTVVYPYVATAGGPKTLGLIDMATGKIERLVPGDVPSSGRVLWARDSQSLLVFTSSFSEPAVLYDITLFTRRATQVKVGQSGGEWELLGWGASGDEVILTRGGHPRGGDPEQTLATLRRSANGWGRPNTIARAESKFDLNARYYPGAEGRLIVGVKDNLSEPPELAAYDRESNRTLVLTNLNPQLRDLKLGEVTRIRWSVPFDKEMSFGYLIKPVGYIPGKRYPLIIQLKDEHYYPEDKSFILDGQWHLSGAAIQVWAGAGFMVLFTPAPRLLSEVMDTPKEDEYITAHIESCLDMLETQGLIDRGKVAISGWSRSGWWTEYIVTHAKTRFTAASNIDNIEFNLQQYSLNYPRDPDSKVNHWGGLAPWGETAERWREQAIDFKYDKAQTPRLLEVHGMRYGNAVWYAESYAALKTAKIPVEFYVYPDAPHNLNTPLHRLHSLSTHTDWFRFWLQGYEDPAPEKQAQYARWRKMREEWEAAKVTRAGK